MNIYRGLKDEKSDPCQKHSGDKAPAKFRGRRRKRVAFWPGLEGGWDFRSHFKEVVAETVPRGEHMHVRFPPSPLASIPRAHKGISWLPHPASAMSFLKSTFLKGTLITTTQSLQVMKIATACIYFSFIFTWRIIALQCCIGCCHTTMWIGCCRSVAWSCLTRWETPGFPVLHCLPEFSQTQVHRVDDAIQPSHLLSAPSPALHLSQPQGLSQWVGSSQQV